MGFCCGGCFDLWGFFVCLFLKSSIWQRKSQYYFGVSVLSQDSAGEWRERLRLYDKAFKEDFFHVTVRYAMSLFV